jgi:hypothetical protein
MMARVPLFPSNKKTPPANFASGVFWERGEMSAAKKS